MISPIGHQRCIAGERNVDRYRSSEESMRAMDWAEASQFLLARTRTATIATIGRDGHPHVVPVWFTLDGRDVVFSTSSASGKAKNLGRDPRAAVCVDDDTPPFGFVSIKGQAQLIPRPDDFLAWTTRIARRYVGPERAVEMGTRYTEMDDTLVRIRVDSFIAYTDIVT
jgi:PPOX class probable F420-dependent enzyme